MYVCVSVPVVNVSIIVFKDPLCLPSLLLEKFNKAGVSVCLYDDVGNST